MEDRLADPVKAVKTSVRGSGKRDERLCTHTSMGITTYLLTRNRNFGIEKRRLGRVRTGRVRASARSD